MRIMLQNHTFYPILGGIENYLYHVSKVLKEMGHQPLILCEQHEPILSECEIHNGVRIIRHPYYTVPKSKLLMKPVIVSDKLKTFISQYVNDIDLVISRYPHYCFSTNELDLDIPIFYIPPSVFWKQLNKASSHLPLKTKFFNFIWKKSLDNMERESILRSNNTIVFSRNNAESLAQYYMLENFSFHIFPPGVDVNRFSGTKDLQLLEELDIKKEEIVLLCIGRLPPEKNAERLLWELWKLGRKDVKLLIVGDGPEKRRLVRMRNSLGLGKVVSFLGMRADIERFYSIADIFISPSKYEPFGQVILEAMAAGLPCIAFKRILPEYEVASEEIIESGATGFCVNPYDKAEFREKLVYLMDHPDVRRKMGELGRKVCETKFSWEDHVRRLLNLVGGQHS